MRLMGIPASLLLAACSTTAPTPAMPFDPPPAVIAPADVAPAGLAPAESGLAEFGFAESPWHVRSSQSELDTRMSYERGATEPFSFTHLSFDAEWIPAMWVTADVDENGAPGTRGDLDTGSGLALRAGLGSNQQNIGLLYMETWHDEQTTGRGATTQSLLLDFLYRAPIPEMNNTVWFEVDAGLGAAELSFDSAKLDNQTTGSALLHGDLEFRITRALTLAAGGGGFIWGHFGDTIAYGTYITVGVKLLF